MHPAAVLRGRCRGRGGGAAGRGRGEIGVPVRANGGAQSLGAQRAAQLYDTPRGNSMPRWVNGAGVGNNPVPAPRVQQQDPAPVDNGRGRGRGRGRGNMAAAAGIVQPQPAPTIPGNSSGSGVPVRGTAAGNGGRGRGAVRLPRNFAQPVQVPPARQPSFSGAGVASRSPSPIPPVGPVAVGLQVRGVGDPGTSTSIDTSPSPSPPPVANRNAGNNPGNANDGNETIPLDNSDVPTPPISPRIVAARPMAGTPMRTRTRPGNSGKTTGTGAARPRSTRKPPAKAPKRRSEELNVFHGHSPSIPFATFRRLVRQCGDEYNLGLIWQKEAIDALREAAEDYLTNLFGMTAAIADNSGRSTIMEKDFNLATNLQTFLGINLDRRSTRERGF